MKCIVTGGAGFIGSNLVERLVNLKHKVVVIDDLSTGRIANLENVKKKISFKNHDLSKDIKKLKKFFKNVDWVFHLAGKADIVPSINNPSLYFDTNVKGTLNLLEILRKEKIKKFIYSASASCYGIPKEYPTKETAKIDCQYPYALTKRLGEEIVLHWANLYKLPALSLRFFNVYGTKSRTSGTYGAVFGVFLAQKLANRPLTIVGNGTQTRDFTYVSDVVSAMIKAVKSHFVGNIYNVGSGNTVSVNKLVSLLSDKYEYIPKRPGEPNCTFADINKIKKDLNWLPEISIETGTKIIIENIDYWKNAPVWTPKTIEKETKDWFHYLGKT